MRYKTLTAVLILLILSIWTAETQAYCRADIEVESTLKKGAWVSAYVTIKGAQNVAAYRLDVTCNGAIVQIHRADNGTFFSDAGTSYFSGGVLSSDRGEIKYILGVRTARGGVCGDGILCAIRLKAVRVGTTTIKIAELDLVDTAGKKIYCTTGSAVTRVMEYPAWDVDNDGRVGISDLVLVAQNFGKDTSGHPYPNPDVNGNNVVDLPDLVLVAQHFGEQYPMAPSRLADVPTALELSLLRKAYGLASEAENPDAVTLRVLRTLIDRAPEPKAASWGKIKGGE